MPETNHSKIRVQFILYKNIVLAEPRHNRNFLVLEVKVAAFEINNYLFFKVNIIAEFFK